MSRKIFITGTDTNVGKTYISIHLLRTWNQQGLRTLGIKPLATGCNQQLQNEDAILLQQASSIKLDYPFINPIALTKPIAPHIAAQLENVALSAELLTELCQPALTHPADICLIEGVGGWHVPLNDHETMADFVRNNQFEVILVVGMRLGCLNHAILTERALRADNINLIGWVANKIDCNFNHVEENINTLERYFQSKPLNPTTL